jgi:CMP-N-acetylneuraminic acid synthetase
VPNKNFRDWQASPIPLHHRYAAGMSRIERVVVNTDSQPIQEDLAKNYKM